MKDYYGKDATRLKNKKLFLFDMDGTIYLGDNLFEGVPQLLEEIKNNGGRYVFITNNASKSVFDYVAKLHRLGLTNVTKEHFFTSAQAMLMILKEKHANDLIFFTGDKLACKGIQGERIKNHDRVHGRGWRNRGRV